MTSNSRHGLPPRLMARQPTRFTAAQESKPSPSPGIRMRASEQDRPDVARHRRRWRVWQRYMDADRFVFLDETGATTAMTRLSGWGPKGERLVDAAPYGHWKTTTVVAGPGGARGVVALRLGGGTPTPGGA